MGVLLLVLFAGVVAGFFLKGKARARLLAEKASTAFVLVLLFLLGLSVGADKTVLRSIREVGVHSVLIAAGGVLGSVLLAGALSRLLFRGISHEE